MNTAENAAPYTAPPEIVKVETRRVWCDGASVNSND
jgi:hypothetical protein